MNRIDLITETIVNQYMNEAGESKYTYSSGGWSPSVIFRGSHESGLTKHSIRIPKSYVKRDGTVSTNRLVELLYKSVRRDVARGLGYYCGVNMYGRFEIFYKKNTNVFYSRHDWNEFLKIIFK